MILTHSPFFSSSSICARRFCAALVDLINSSRSLIFAARATHLTRPDKMASKKSGPSSEIRASSSGAPIPVAPFSQFSMVRADIPVMHSRFIAVFSGNFLVTKSIPARLFISILFGVPAIFYSKKHLLGEGMFDHDR